jgi:hypothetical protein
MKLVHRSACFLIGVLVAVGCSEKSGESRPDASSPPVPGSGGASGAKPSAGPEAGTTGSSGAGGAKPAAGSGAGTAGNFGAGGRVGSAGVGTAGQSGRAGNAAAGRGGQNSAGAGGAGGSAGVAASGGAMVSEWQAASLTNFTSYPDPGSDECVKYNGCMWAGQFAAVDGKQTEAWVMSHNIAAVHSKDFNLYKLKTLRLRKDGKEIDVTVYDECSDSDCSGCCTQNAKPSGFLIDIERYTAERFGVSDGQVEWACLDCK